MTRPTVEQTYLAVSAIDYLADMTVTISAILLMQARGLPPDAIFATVGGLSIVGAVFDYPTGVVADIVGRRFAVCISFGIRALAYALIFATSSPILTCIGVVLTGFGQTFLSGALEAWVVDESAAAGGSLDALFARGRVAENLGLVAGTVGGALLGTWNLALPQAFAALFSAAGLALGLFVMTESRAARAAQRGAAERRSFGADVRAMVADVADLVRADTVFVAIALAAAAFWLFRSLAFVQWTAAFAALTGGNLILLGVMRSASALLEIPLLRLMGRGDGASAGRRMAIIVGASACAGAALLVAAFAGAVAVRMAGFIVFALACGLCMPGIRAAMNDRVGSSSRAGALSLASTLMTLVAGGGLFVAGRFVTDLRDVRGPWLLAAVGVVVSGLVAGEVAKRCRPQPLQPLGVADASLEYALVAD